MAAACGTHFIFLSSAVLVLKSRSWTMGIRGRSVVRNILEISPGVGAMVVIDTLRARRGHKFATPWIARRREPESGGRGGYVFR